MTHNIFARLKLGLIQLWILWPPPVQAADAILGRWLTDDRAAIIRISRCGEMLCGKIEHVLDPRAPTNDINNPDRQRRSKPLVGVLVLRGFVGSGSYWKGGRAYDPKTGNSYRSELKLLNNGQLKVTGCIFLLCRSRYWTPFQ